MAGLLVLSAGIGIGLLASGAGFALGSPVSSADDVQQQNPDDVGSSGELSPVERQLADRAARQVRSGAVNISDEQYDQAREALDDDEYEALLERYSEVASQTGNENRSRLLASLSENQRAYARASDEYRTLHALLTGTADLSDPETRAAAAELSFVNGTELNRTVDPYLFAYGPDRTVAAEEVLSWNRTENRQAVRELENRWQRVNETGTTLLRNYRQLQETGPEDYSNSIAAIRENRERIEQTHQEVRRQFLTTVVLDVEARDTRGSFADPIPITGRLTTANGTALANETGRLEIANQSYRTRTSRYGRFVVAYRPTSVGLNASTVSVRFIPDTSSNYTTAESNVSVTVEQVRPDVSVTARPAEVRFNETLTVSGRVGLDRAGAGNVSYLVTLDGEFLSSNRTSSDGTFESQVPVPAAVASGDREIRVGLLQRNRALGPTNGTATVRVRETPTTLSVSASHTEGRSLRVAGNLSAPNHGGIADREVRIEANGTSLGTVTTGPDGQFDTTVIVPSESIDGGLFSTTTALGIRAVHDGAGSNLETATAQTGVTVTTNGTGEWLVGVAAAGIVLLGGYLGYRRWRRVRRGERGDPRNVGDPVARVQESVESDESLVALARDQLSAGRRDVAVQLGYAAVRRRFEGQVGHSPSATHWEFYRACLQGLDDAESRELLRRTTELYERAVYASESVSEETVGALLDEIDVMDHSSSAD